MPVSNRQIQQGVHHDISESNGRTDKRYPLDLLDVWVQMKAAPRNDQEGDDPYPDEEETACASFRQRVLVPQRDRCEIARENGEPGGNRARKPSAKREG